MCYRFGPPGLSNLWSCSFRQRALGVTLYERPIVSVHVHSFFKSRISTVLLLVRVYLSVPLQKTLSVLFPALRRVS